MGTEQAHNTALLTLESKETLIYPFLLFRAKGGIFWVLLTQLAVSGEAG